MLKVHNDRSDIHADGPDPAWLMNQLQQPTAYPHPVASIRLIQTHVSCVFLTGDYVYKVKKPVDFGFLNYKTLPLRRHWCEEELRLNRRLCPDIYLRVLPITLNNGHLTIAGNGTPVEWAVWMRQLREEDMLPARLQNGAVTHEQIEHIACSLATFHAAAPTSDIIRHFGLLHEISNTIALTLKTMYSVSSAMLDAKHRDTLREYLDKFLVANADLFHKRRIEGRIRDCHGDLRAQNICLDPRFDGGLQVFDCIEFNNAFRYIDVAADIAYIAMDLDLAGRTDLSACLLHAYEKKTGDTLLAEILPFYLVYRAIVRGNIALLAAAEQEIPKPERQAHHDLAAAAYDLALCYAARGRTPALFITVGYSGSGKSVLAGELVRRLPAVHLSSDVLRKERAVTNRNGLQDAELYTKACRAENYKVLRQRAAPFLDDGQNVLLDATFLDPQERSAAAHLAKRHNATMWILHCHCPDAVIRQRLHLRKPDRNASDAGIGVYAQQNIEFPNAGKSRLAKHGQCRRVVVDTNLPAIESAHTVVDRFITDLENKLASDRSCLTLPQSGFPVPKSRGPIDSGAFQDTPSTIG